MRISGATCGKPRAKTSCARSTPPERRSPPSSQKATLFERRHTSRNARGKLRRPAGSDLNGKEAAERVLVPQMWHHFSCEEVHVPLCEFIRKYAKLEKCHQDPEPSALAHSLDAGQHCPRAADQRRAGLD